MRNKRDELEALVLSQICGVIGIGERWWDESQGRSAAMEGCQGVGRAGEVVVVCFMQGGGGTVWPLLLGGCGREPLNEDLADG